MRNWEEWRQQGKKWGPLPLSLGQWWAESPLRQVLGVEAVCEWFGTVPLSVNHLPLPPVLRLFPLPTSPNPCSPSPLWQLQALDSSFSPALFFFKECLMKRDPYPHEISFQHSPFQLPSTVSKWSFREFHITSLVLSEILSRYPSTSSRVSVRHSGLFIRFSGTFCVQVSSASPYPESCFFLAPFLRHASARTRASPKTSFPNYVFGKPSPCLNIYFWRLYTCSPCSNL